MTLTRDAILQKTAPRFAWVEIEGWGKVGIRSVSRVRQSLRESSMRDEATGELIPEELAKADAYSMIDQLMVSESEPMFIEGDAEMLAAADTAALMPLLLAINEFNVKGAAPGK